MYLNDIIVKILRNLKKIAIFSGNRKFFVQRHNLVVNYHKTVILTVLSAKRGVFTIGTGTSPSKLGMRAGSM